MKFEIDSDEELWMGEEQLGKEDIQYLVNTLYKKEFMKLKEEAEAKLDDLLYQMLHDVEVEETFNKILKRSFETFEDLPDRNETSPKSEYMGVFKWSE